MDTPDSLKKQPDLDPSHELPSPHDMELKAPYDMELPKPHDMQLKPHLTHRHSFLHWLPAIIGLLVGISVGIYFAKIAPENRKEINEFYAKPTQTPAVSKNQTNEWMYYTNTQYKYSLKYPKGWNVFESTQFHSNTPRSNTSRFEIDKNILQTVLFEDIHTNRYNGNFAITVQPYTTHLETIAKEYFLPLSSNPSINMAKFIGPTAVNGFLAKEFSIFAFDREINRIFTIHNNYLYQIDFDRANPNDSYFNQNQEIYKQMLASITLDGNATNSGLTITPEPSSRVFCPQDIKQCPDGTFVRRAEPTCEFLPCTNIMP